MTGLAATAALLLSLGATGWEGGWAVYYGQGVIEDVAERRAIPPQPCFVAYTHARDADMGALWLRVVGPGGAATCLVVDLPEARDRAALQARGIIVELGYANRWICGPAWSGRARDCRVRVIPIRARE